MKCSYCRTPAVHYAHHFGKFLCKSHLEGYLLRKLRRNLNKHKLVSQGDVVAIRQDGSPAGAAAEALFRKAVAGWPVKVVDPEEKHNKLLVTHTLEHEANAIVEGLAAGKFPRSGYSEGETIKPFRDFSSKELFVLGWMNGCKKEGADRRLPQGTASQLNLLRSWDLVQEIEGRPRNTASKLGATKRGQ